MSLVASAIATEGSAPVPYLLKEVLNHKGEIESSSSNSVWQQVIKPSTAELLRESMEAIVENGTAQRLAVDGLTIGAKTGTAQLSADNDATHAWIVGFAGSPDEPPLVAFAVFVEADSDIGEQTGGRTAAPIARDVLLEIFDLND